MDRFTLSLSKAVIASIKRILFFAAASAALATISSAAVVFAPQETSFRNVPFSRPNGRNICLDLYVPRASAPSPVVVWFHGGGWKYGDKRIRILVRGLTRCGFAVASAQYRLTWSAKWPAQREDSLAAIDWLRAHGKEYGVDGRRIGLSGASAGGHLAALAGVLEKTPRVKAVAVFYPPTDMTALSAHYRDDRQFNLIVQLFGAPYEKTARQAAESSPVNFITRRTPPFLFIHGDGDIVVPVDQSRKMDRLLREAGIESHLIVLRGKMHGFELDEALLRKVAIFFKVHL